MQYTKVRFAPSEGESWQIDLLIQALGELGFDSFEEGDGAEFIGYIPTPNFDLNTLDHLLLNQPGNFTVTYDYQDIDAQNWNQLWESNFHPIEIDQRCYVRASFHEPKPDYLYEIIIEPKMAFGTGHHQTTSMMMRLLLDIELDGKSVLDMGCGSGILAILAAKMEASSVLAIDHDPVGCDSTQENALRNDVKQVTIRCGSVEWILDRRFDVVLANITRNVLEEHIPLYAKVIRKGGVLLISGFFFENDLQFLTLKASQVGLKLEISLKEGDWAAAKLVKF